MERTHGRTTSGRELHGLQIRAWGGERRQSRFVPGGRRDPILINSHLDRAIRGPAGSRTVGCPVR